MMGGDVVRHRPNSTYGNEQGEQRLYTHIIGIGVH